jgi:hypothetical protein
MTSELREASDAVPLVRPGRGDSDVEKDARAALWPRLPSVNKHGWLIAVLGFGGLLLHRGWFRPGLLSYGDWWPYATATMHALFRAPQAWDATHGFGMPNIGVALAPYEFLYGLLSRLGISYSVAERVTTFFPYVVLPFLSTYALAGDFVTKRSSRAAAAVVYGCNTYALDVGNSQMTVALAFALAPLLLHLLIRGYRQTAGRAHVGTQEQGSRRFSGYRWPLAVSAGIKCGVVLAISMVVEPRISLLTVAACALYTVMAEVTRRRAAHVATVFGVMLVTAVGLHSYWLVPTLLGGQSSQYGSLLPTRPFVSWATLTHAIALNSPWWTAGRETVFTVQPPMAALLVLPVVAFGTLALGRYRHDRKLRAVAVLALLGVFLVKGENGPLGWVYTRAFNAVPGMRLFRDMSKFNLFIALGYAVLIASCIEFMTDLGVRRTPSRSINGWQQRIPLFATVAVLGVALFASTRPYLSQKFGGTLRPTAVPQRFRDVQAFLDSDTHFGRVLWVPGELRFSPRSDTHPVVAPVDLIEPMAREGDVPFSDGLSPVHVRAVSTLSFERDRGLDALRGQHLSDVFRQTGIRYVVVSTDSSDDTWTGSTNIARQTQIDEAMASLSATPGLELVKKDAKLVTMRVRDPAPFASVGDRGPDGAVVNGRAAAATRSWDGSRLVSIKQPDPGRSRLLVTEHSDPGWRASFQVTTAVGTRDLGAARVYAGMFNVWDFDVPDGATRVTARLTYSPQRETLMGTWISVVFTLLILLTYLVSRVVRRRRHA